MQHKISLNSFLKLSFNHPYNKGFEQAIKGKRNPTSVRKQEVCKAQKGIYKKEILLFTRAHPRHVTSSINYVHGLCHFGSIDICVEIEEV